MSKRARTEVGVDRNFLIQLDSWCGIKASGTRIKVQECLDGSKFQELGHGLV